jgi:2-amino-4-hydroxy-6-hydroxymethyldihydropteridine diphosphokinase
MTLQDRDNHPSAAGAGEARLYEAFIALGSNLGDRERYLQEAIRLLNDHPLIEVIRCSDVYETDPVGYADQGSFLNMVAAVRTALSPSQLHAHMQHIENRLGRVRTIPNGPRTVDLDLLLYDHTELHTPELTVPHPRMWERAFVLVPLLDAIGERPEFRASITRRLDTLEGKEGVLRWSSFNWPSGFGLSGS